MITCTGSSCRLMLSRLPEPALLPCPVTRRPTAPPPPLPRKLLLSSVSLLPLIKLIFIIHHTRYTYYDDILVLLILRLCNFYAFTSRSNFAMSKCYFKSISARHNRVIKNKRPILRKFKKTLITRYLWIFK